MARWSASDATVYRFGERENQFCRICRWVDGKGLTRVVHAGDAVTMGQAAYRAHRRRAFAKHANEFHPHTASNPRSS